MLKQYDLKQVFHHILYYAILGVPIVSFTRCQWVTDWLINVPFLVCSWRNNVSFSDSFSPFPSWVMTGYNSHNISHGDWWNCHPLYVKSYLRDVNGSQSDGLTTCFFDALEGITYHLVIHFSLFSGQIKRQETPHNVSLIDRWKRSSIEWFCFSSSY